MNFLIQNLSSQSVISIQDILGEENFTLFEDFKSLEGMDLALIEGIILDLDDLEAQKAHKKILKKLLKKHEFLKIIYLTQSLGSKEMAKHQRGDLGGDVYLKYPFTKDVVSSIFNDLFEINLSSEFTQTKKDASLMEEFKIDPNDTTNTNIKLDEQINEELEELTSSINLKFKDAFGSDFTDNVLQIDAQKNNKIDSDYTQTKEAVNLPNEDDILSEIDLGLDEPINDGVDNELDLNQGFDIGDEVALDEDEVDPLMDLEENSLEETDINLEEEPEALSMSDNNEDQDNDLNLNFEEENSEVNLENEFENKIDDGLEADNDFELQDHSGEDDIFGDENQIGEFSSTKIEAFNLNDFQEDAIEDSENEEELEKTSSEIFNALNEDVSSLYENPLSNEEEKLEVQEDLIDENELLEGQEDELVLGDDTNIGLDNEEQVSNGLELGEETLNESLDDEFLEQNFEDDQNAIGEEENNIVGDVSLNIDASEFSLDSNEEELEEKVPEPTSIDLGDDFNLDLTEENDDLEVPEESALSFDEGDIANEAPIESNEEDLLAIDDDQDLLGEGEEALSLDDESFEQDDAVIEGGDDLFASEDEVSLDLNEEVIEEDNLALDSDDPLGEVIDQDAISDDASFSLDDDVGTNEEDIAFDNVLEDLEEEPVGELTEFRLNNQNAGSTNLEEDLLAEIDEKTSFYVNQNLQEEADAKHQDISFAMSDEVKRKLAEIDQILANDMGVSNSSLSSYEPQSSNQNYSSPSQINNINASGVIGSEKEQTYNLEGRNLRDEKIKLLNEIRQINDSLKVAQRDNTILLNNMEEKDIELKMYKNKAGQHILSLQQQVDDLLTIKRKLEEKNIEFQKQLKNIEIKFKTDLNSPNLNRSDLEQKLELLKIDSETQLRNRDRKILELKRKIDMLEFDMENLLLKEKQTYQKQVEDENRYGQIMNALHQAIKLLEEDKKGDLNNNINDLINKKKNLNM